MTVAPVTAAELAAWTELADGVTKGELRFVPALGSWSTWNADKTGIYEFEFPSEDDAAFFDQARSALPRLIAAYSQSQARVAELEAAIREHRDLWDREEGCAHKTDVALWSVLPQSEGA